MRIRTETAADIDAIRRVTTSAFALAAHSGGNEARIVEALRQAGALSLSLVADLDGRIAGHVALSPVELDNGDAGWFGLGPLSVGPGDQKLGIGSALMRAALAALPELDAAGCVVFGYPAYYTRFGFRQHTPLSLPGLTADHFMVLAMQDADIPAAAVTYHPAFQVA